MDEKMETLTTQVLQNATAIKVSRYLKKNWTIKIIIKIHFSAARRMWKMDAMWVESIFLIENLQTNSKTGADVNETHSFTASDKHYYYNNTWVTKQSLREIAKMLLCLHFSFWKVHWQEASDWCTERGMRLASLPTLSEVEAVITALENSDLGNKSKALQQSALIFNLYLLL